jgi:meiotic recombination protein SPO11
MSARGPRLSRPPASAASKPKPKLKRKASELTLDEIVAPVEALAAELRATPKRRRVNEAGRHVVAMTRDEVMDAVEGLVLTTTTAILEGAGPEVRVPSREPSNVRYDPGLGHNVMGARETRLTFRDAKQAGKLARLLRCAQLVYELCSKGMSSTKRDLFYCDVRLFGKQEASDAVIEDLAATLGCPRASMGVVASEKGVMIGAARFRDGPDEVDCARVGPSGKNVPAAIERVTELRCDARFVLLVEKDAAFARLAEDRFHERYRCVALTGKGEPDVATRLMLRRLVEASEGGALPVLALVDADPHGLEILLTYRHGSRALAHEAAALACPDVRWLGLRPSDLDRYDVPASARLPFAKGDAKKARELLEHPAVKADARWIKEVQRMIDTETKAEIQALSAHGLRYLTEEFLPRKLAAGDWI